MKFFQLALLLIIFLPMVGAGILCFLSKKVEVSGRFSEPHCFFQTATWLILLVTLILPVLHQVPDQQTLINYNWFPEIGLNFSLLFDSLTYLLALFTTFIFLLLSINLKGLSRSFYAAILLVEASILGVIFSYNLLLFYFFFELMLFPLFYLLYVYGSQESKKSAYKFLLYTLAGSLGMLLSIVYLGYSYYQETGVFSFLLSDLLRLDLTISEQSWIFAGFFVAFAVKSPIFPFHTWLPDTYSNAPRGVAVVMAGLLFQAGIYGLFRFAMVLCPAAFEQYAGVVAVLAVIGIVYGALLAWVQTSAARILSYASISHVGFSVLGLSLLTVAGVLGGMFLLVAHILIAAALFLLIDALRQRGGTDEISQYSGLAVTAPRFSFFMVCFSLAAISLPLTISFVGEFIVLKEAFAQNQILAIFALLGVVIGAVYMLRLCQSLLFGAPLSEANNFQDLNRDEVTVLSSILLLVVVLGLYPKVVLGLMEPVVESQISLMERKAAPYRMQGEQPQRKMPSGIILTSGAR